MGNIRLGYRRPTTSPQSKTVLRAAKANLFETPDRSAVATVFDELLPLKFMCGCLGGGIPALTASGVCAPIEEIRIGDLLATPSGTARVVNTWRGRENGLLEIGYEGGSVRMTAPHPVLTPSGYVKAGDLSVGSEICLFGGSNRHRQNYIRQPADGGLHGL